MKRNKRMTWNKRYVGLVGIISLGWWGVVGLAQAQDYYRDAYNRVCPILDMPYQASQELTIDHTLGADSETPGWGDRVRVTDIRFWGRLAALENEWGGELEMRGHLDLRVLEGFAAASGIDRFYTLGMMRMAFIWHQRFLGGVGLQLRSFPGLYMALDEPGSDLFAIPAGARLIYAITPDLAVFGGADVYPGFDVEIDPEAGVVYTYQDSMRLKMGYPETEWSWSPHLYRFRLEAGATFSRWPEYRLGAGDEREWIRMTENRVYVGIGGETLGGMEVLLRGGYVWDREVHFGGDAAGVTLEDAPFVMLGFRGLL